MNYNVSSFDSKYHSEITEDIAHVLQSDSSESLKRSSSSDYIDDCECRDKMQSFLDNASKRMIDGRCTPRVTIQTGGANDSDPNSCCHRVVKSVSFSECFPNNPCMTEHTVTCEIPGTLTHTLSEDACRCDETVDAVQRSSLTNVIQAHLVDLSGTKSKKGSVSYNVGEKDIDDILSKLSSQAKDTDIASTTPPNLPIKDSIQYDRKKLIRRINELEAEKLDGEKKLLDMKLTMLSLQKEKESLNDQFASLQEEFLSQQVTDHGKTKLQKKICQLEKLNSQAERELQSLKSCVVAIKTEKECLLKKILDLEEDLEEQKEKNSKLTRDREKGRSRVDEANRWVESLREWKTKAVSDMEITKNNVAKFSTLVKQNSLHLKTVRSRNKKLRKKLKKASSLLKEGKSHRQSLENENRELTLQVEQMRAQMEEKSAEIERSQLDLFETRDMNVALQKRLENVAESKLSHSKQSNDVIQSLEKDLNDLKLRMETIEDEHRDELEKLEKEIDTEKTMRNFMIISYKTLEDDYNTLYNSSLDFRQVMTAVVQGTNFVSGI